jgi:hypothetical protein
LRFELTAQNIHFVILSEVVRVGERPFRRICGCSFPKKEDPGAPVASGLASDSSDTLTAFGRTADPSSPPSSANRPSDEDLSLHPKRQKLLQALPATFERDLPTPPFDREQTEGSIGGPIRPDKASWFSSFEFRDQKAARQTGSRDFSNDSILSTT